LAKDLQNVFFDKCMYRAVGKIVKLYSKMGNVLYIHMPDGPDDE
jgi:hypothetical protein